MSGSSTFDSGSGNFTVVTYYDLTVEVWGDGGGSYGASGGAAPTVVGHNGTGSTATIGATVLTANGGVGGGHFYTDVHGTGGTASGGDVNTPGGDGDAGGFGSNAAKGGGGGNSPNGGLGGVAIATQSVGFFNGNNGAAPGGGGGGVKRNPDATNRNWGNGSGAGGYSKKVYRVGVTAGAPSVGSTIAYVVGPGGAGGIGTDDTGGSGAAGRVKFTWTDAPDVATVAQTLFAPTQSAAASTGLVKLVVVGLGKIETSYDGVTWASRDAPDNLQYSSVCWSPELQLFVAVGDGSGLGSQHAFMSSPNGLTWTRRTAPGGNDNNTWTGICWSPALGLFCAVADNPGSKTYTFATSTDGFTWTGRAGLFGSWHGITWAPSLGLFIAVSSGGSTKIATSPDGTNWTLHSDPANLSWQCVAWSPGLALAAALSNDGGTQDGMTSANGTSWTRRTTQKTSYTSVAWSPTLGKFVGVGTGVFTPQTHYDSYSSDGVTWTEGTLAGSNWNGLCWSIPLSMFVACGQAGSNRIATSTDPTTSWTLQTDAVNGGWAAIAASTLPTASATIAQTLSGITQAAAATEKNNPTISQTLFAPTQAVAAKEIEKAAIAQTLFAPTQAIVANEVEKSTITQTLFAPTQAIVAKEVGTAAITQTLFNIVETATDIELEPVHIIQTLSGITQSATVYNSSLDPAMIVQTLLGISSQEMDVVERERTAIAQTLFGITQEIEALEIEPAMIAQTLFGIEQEIDTSESGGSAPDVTAVIAQIFRRRLVTQTASAAITTVLRGFSQHVGVRNVALGKHPLRPGQSGINKPRMSQEPPISNAELEFFRTKVYARNVDGLVPPPVIANRNLTTTQHPKSRPVVVPAPRGKPK